MEITRIIINNQPTLIVKDGEATTDPDGRTHLPTIHQIPIMGLASHRELLGLDSDAETLKAIIHVRNNGEPASDAETGRNAWTSAYEQSEKDALNALNQVRAAALHPAMDASGRLLADGRAETRRLLGLPSTTTDTYEADAAMAAAQALDGTDAPTASATDALAELLEPYAAEIEEARERFVQAITPQYRKDR